VGGSKLYFDIKKKKLLYFPLISVFFIFISLTFQELKFKKKILKFIDNFEHERVVMRARLLRTTTISIIKTTPFNKIEN